MWERLPKHYAAYFSAKRFPGSGSSGAGIRLMDKEVSLWREHPQFDSPDQRKTRLSSLVHNYCWNHKKQSGKHSTAPTRLLIVTVVSVWQYQGRKLVFFFLAVLCFLSTVQLIHTWELPGFSAVGHRVASLKQMVVSTLLVGFQQVELKIVELVCMCVLCFISFFQYFCPPTRKPLPLTSMVSHRVLYSGLSC